MNGIGPHSPLFAGHLSDGDFAIDIQDESSTGSSFLDQIVQCDFVWTNPLSVAWLRPIRQNSYVKYSLPVFYVAGMVGYTLALIARICVVVYRVFGLIPALAHALSSWELFPLKEQFAHTCESVVYVGTAVVGIVCPPLGYHLDAKFLRWTLDHFSQFFWRRNDYFFQAMSASSGPGSIMENLVENLAERFDGVSEIRNKVKARMKNENACFVEAMQIAEKNGLEFEDLSSQSMSAITELAGVLIGQKKAKGFADYIIVQGEYDTTAKEKALKDCIEAMHTQWKTLEKSVGKKKLLSCLVQKFAEENDVDCTQNEDLSILPPNFDNLVSQAKVFSHICEGQCRVAWGTLYHEAWKSFSEIQ